ncbi:MAG: DUF116 domain-containing protein [Candidatus Goldiibacteriota bacterium]
MSGEKDSEKDIISRNLGDEWQDWAGNLSAHNKEIKEGKRLFLAFYSAAFVFIAAGAVFIYYLISPRLYQWHPYLDVIVLWVIIIIFGSVLIWSVFLAAALGTGKNFFPLRRKSGIHLEWMYPFILKIGDMFGISKDRLWNSLIVCNNTLVYAARKKYKTENILVLLPRCLDRETRTAAAEIAEKYGCRTFTATGGSSARQMVKKTAPDAIIGVACERDLISGMADVPHNITVIGIPNTRPEGPCKNTRIDADDLEKAVKFLIKAE